MLGVCSLCVFCISEKKKQDDCAKNDSLLEVRHHVARGCSSTSFHGNPKCKRVERGQRLSYLRTPICLAQHGATDVTSQTFGVKFSRGRRGRSCTGRCSFLASTNKIAHLLVGLVVHTLVTNYTPVVGSVPPESNMTPLTRQVYTCYPWSCLLRFAICTVAGGRVADARSVACAMAPSLQAAAWSCCARVQWTHLLPSVLQSKQASVRLGPS